MRESLGRPFQTDYKCMKIHGFNTQGGSVFSTVLGTQTSNIAEEFWFPFFVVMLVSIAA
jgi:hypothetical protein